MKQIKRGEIYFADLSQTIGCEQSGFRPVLIIQNDVGNKYSPATIVAPITSRQRKKKIPTHTIVRINGMISCILTEQIRTIDKQRLGRYIGKLNLRQLESVDRAIRISLGLQ